MDRFQFYDAAIREEIYYSVLEKIEDYTPKIANLYFPKEEELVNTPIIRETFPLIAYISTDPYKDVYKDNKEYQRSVEVCKELVLIWPLIEDGEK